MHTVPLVFSFSVSCMYAISFLFTHKNYLQFVKRSFEKTPAGGVLSPLPFFICARLYIIFHFICIYSHISFTNYVCCRPSIFMTYLYSSVQQSCFSHDFPVAESERKETPSGL